MHSSSNIFSFQTNIYNTRASNANIVSLPNIFTTHSRQSARWVGAREWNGLPDDVRHLHQSTSTFKYKVKRYLVNSNNYRAPVDVPQSVGACSAPLLSSSTYNTSIAICIFFFPIVWYFALFSFSVYAFWLVMFLFFYISFF